MQAPTDWIGAFKRLNAAWDDPIIDAGREWAWSRLSGTPDAVGGQDPKLLDLGAGRVLVLAGAPPEAG